MNGDGESISTERALRVLADHERRLIVDRLAGERAETTVERLATALDDAASAASSEGPRTEARVQLHHRHLPALAQADVIQYDASQGVVRRGEAFEAVRSLLDTIDDGLDVESKEDPCGL